MGNTAIELNGIGKTYHIASNRQSSDMMAVEVGRMLTAPLRRARKLLSGQATGAAELDEAFWALRDISFNIEHGEVVGIIGRNGAGKSTLLKILSQITEPSVGYAHIYGRVGALLEVGTGFHAELTGYENIYLNGSILGMSRAEITAKLDDIVEFAGVERFLHTPVKHYSSGMGVRLAFAVAAHLEPEILLVDEVLAVGDAEFQRKSLGKMSSVAKEGRTVLFVSHNLAAISSLCTRVVLLEQGCVVADGEPSEVLDIYMQSFQMQGGIKLSERKDRKGDGRVRFTELLILNKDGDVTDTVVSGEDVRLRFCYESVDSERLNNVMIGLGVYSAMGHFVFYGSNEMIGLPLNDLPPTGSIDCLLPRLLLTSGIYPLNIAFTVNGIMADWVQDAVSLNVVEGDFFGTGKLPPASHGGVLVQQDWFVYENIVE